MEHTRVAGERRIATKAKIRFILLIGSLWQLRWRLVDSATGGVGLCGLSDGEGGDD